jgi:hypothetical protein
MQEGISSAPLKKVIAETKRTAVLRVLRTQKCEVMLKNMFVHHVISA